MAAPPPTIPMVDPPCFMIYYFFYTYNDFCATVFIVCFELPPEFIYMFVYRLGTMFLVFYT